MVYIKCGDYVFDPKVTRVQFQDTIAENVQSKLITITGLLKSANPQSLIEEINTLNDGIYQSPVAFYYPTAEESITTNLLSVVCTPQINGKAAAIEIKLGQDNEVFQGASVQHSFNNLSSGASFSINYSGSKNYSLSLSMVPSADIIDLLLRSSQNELGRYLGRINAASELKLDHENSFVTNDKVNAWPQYQGDLFTLASGMNEFIMEFVGSGTIDVTAKYVVCYQ